MSSCSQCKTPIGLVVTKCHNCGLDFDTFRATQQKKANAWMKGGIIFIIAMFALIALFNFLLVPLVLLAIGALLYCLSKRSAELSCQPIEIFTNKSKGNEFY